MAPLFDANGIIELSKFNKIIKGEQEIISFFHTLHEKFKGVTHWESNIVINFSDDLQSANNTSYWKAIRQNDIISYGSHKDTFVILAIMFQV